MYRIRSFFRKQFFTEIDSIGLSIFRFFYATILFLEAFQLYTYREIIYDKIEISTYFIFFSWLLTITCLIFGLFTKLVAVLNYLFSVIVFNSNDLFEYNIFYTYLIINLLIIFTPVSQQLSLDSLIKKIKSNQISQGSKPTAMRIYYYLPVLTGIALVYFDSILFKLNSPIWLNGLGLWLPISLPMTTWTDLSFIANNELLIKFMGYFTLIFEIIFIFLFWFNFFRIPLLIIGVILHVGILIAFPIPWFALTFLSIYILMIPICFWKKLLLIFQKDKRKFYFYYNNQSIRSIKIALIINSLDIFKRIELKSEFHNTIESLPTDKKLQPETFGLNNNGDKFTGGDVYIQVLKHMKYTWPLGFILSILGIKQLYIALYSILSVKKVSKTHIINSHLTYSYKPKQRYFQNQWFNKKLFLSVLLVSFLFLQTIISWTTPTVQNLIWKSGFNLNKINNRVITLKKNITPFCSRFLGINNHPLFMDNHFKNYNQIIRIDIVDQNNQSLTLPLLNKQGMPSTYIRGALWANYTFRTSNPSLPQNLYEKRIMPYLMYYCKHNSINKKHVHFVFYSKQLEIPKTWKKNILHEQFSKPWKIIGTYYFSGHSKGFIWKK